MIYLKRGFKIVSRYQQEKIKLPARATQTAAGYDFFAAQDFVLPSIWRSQFVKVLLQFKKSNQQLTSLKLQAAQKCLRPFLVPTGIKAYMQPDEFLLLANRSSGPLKRSLVLPNGVGIVDADYYDNPGNEGEIFFQLLNFGLKDQNIKQGEKIGQGIFLPFLPADDEVKPQNVRQGGFGSSGK
jgi:dUTP pyrophosphatase